MRSFRKEINLQRQPRDVQPQTSEMKTVDSKLNSLNFETQHLLFATGELKTPTHSTATDDCHHASVQKVTNNLTNVKFRILKIMNAVDLSTLLILEQFHIIYFSCTVPNCNTQTNLGLKRLPEGKYSGTRQNSTSTNYSRRRAKL